MRKISIAYTNNERKRCGVNLLEGIKPEITPLSDKKVIFEKRGDFSESILDNITNIESSEHIDFYGAPFCLTYDLKRVIIASSAMVTSFNELYLYVIKEFEVYISENRDDLYSPEHKIGFNISEKSQRYGHYTCSDWIFDISGIPFRYFGFKAVKSCESDEICRVKGLYIFDNKINDCELYVKRSFPQNLLGGATVTAEGNYSGNLAALTDEKAFCGSVYATENCKFIIETGSISANRIYAIGKNLADICFSFGNSKDTLFASASTTLEITPALYGFSTAKAEIPFGEYKYIGISAKSGCIIDEICAESDKRAATVNTNKVINPDFMGIGSNCIATYLSKNSINAGYNTALFELEKRRIKQLRPHVNRIFVPLDWFVETEEDFLSGNYNFKTSDFESLAATIAALKEAGLEVEFDWGWKVADRQISWISFKECVEKGLSVARSSAPTNIEQFAKAGAAAIYELFVNRGLNNIKYISLFNEVAYCVDTAGDFAYPEKGEAKLKYWCQLLRTLKSELKKLGIDNKFKLWAAEQAGYDTGLVDGTMKYINKLAGDIVDAHSVHMYNFNYDDLNDAFSGPIAKEMGGKPVMLTEFSNSSAMDVSYERNHVNTLISMARNGISGGCIWILSGAYLPDPINWVHDGAVGLDNEGSPTFWQFLGTDIRLNQIGESFYELSLFGNYVPNHASVIESEIKNGYSDLRIAAFKSGEDITVAVENAPSSMQKKLEISFGTDINRKFYKYRYSRPSKREENLIIPPCCGVIDVADAINDTIDCEYGLTMYSTIAPVRQVVMKDVCVYAEPGTCVSLSACTIDSDISELSWSVCGATNENAIVSNSGIFTVPAQAIIGDTFAVKAELPTGEYGVSVIRVKPW